jgi:acetylornithine aminotransferase/acetylornithine/N-succinyldiaminopimelate aminotransferase
MHAVSPLLNTIGTAQWPLTLVRAHGARFTDDKGGGYWDFYGGHAVTLIGQGHPHWVGMIASQAGTLSFMTTMAKIPVRERAAKALCDFTGMDVAWFVNSGAEANEGALKMARKATGRPVIIAMENGFHGRTMGALGVTWKYRDQHAPIHGTARFVPFGDLDALDAALDSDVAAVITEPVQGIAGIVTPPPGWLAAVKERCEANGSILICDEVQSGVGRTGTPLVCRAEGVDADIVTLGKGLGGGFPVAAVLMTEAISVTIEAGDHGTTFGGGPLACAAVEATLAIIDSEDLLARATALGELMRTELAVSGVVEIRGSGVWIALVLDRPAKPIAKALRESGFLVGTSTDPTVLRLSPPAVLPEHAITALADALRTALEAT